MKASIDITTNENTVAIEAYVLEELPLGCDLLLGTDIKRKVCGPASVPGFKSSIGIVSLVQSVNTKIMKENS
ncbi:hypothetical protein BLOT_007885 [Blomia tropicalis]|nr:hypothetical protein BLOT_007885 [Blomia tropicalis]